MKVIYFFCLVIFATACVRISDIPPEGEEIATETVIVPAEDLTAHQLRIEGLPNPSQYLVWLPFPREGEVIYRLEKDVPDSAVEVPIVVRNGELVDDQVVSGKTYIYEYTLLGNETEKAKPSLEAKIPLDLFVQNEIVLQKNEVWNQFHRIFFGPAGIISINGFRLDLITDQIYSERGVIRTYAPGSKAPPEQDGRPGGHLHISVRTGFGKLHLEMRGQIGGVGKSGNIVENNRVINGEGGRPGGSTGSANVVIRQKNSLDINVHHEIGRGGPPGLFPHYEQKAAPDGAKEIVCIHDFEEEICL